MKARSSESMISELDSNRFGIKIAKVDDFSNGVEMTVSELKNIGVKLVISRISLENVELVNSLEKCGFLMKDTQVTYSFDYNKNVINKFPNDNVKIRLYQDGDIDTISKIAHDSFSGYGHYFANNRLDKTKCSEIYEDWARRSCNDSKVADSVLVATIDSEIAGFLSLKIKHLESSSYAYGGIGAVNSSFRNKGVFKSLINSALDWGNEQKLNWQEHNVLTTNYPVNKAFVSQGYSVSKSYVTMHNWLS